MGKSGARDVRHSGTHTMKQTDTGTSKGPHGWQDNPGPTATGCSRTACSLESPFTASQNKESRSTMEAAEAARTHREDGHARLCSLAGKVLIENRSSRRAWRRAERMRQMSGDGCARAQGKQGHKEEMSLRLQDLTMGHRPLLRPAQQSPAHLSMRRRRISPLHNGHCCL